MRNCFVLPLFVLSVQFSSTNCILIFYLQNRWTRPLSLAHRNVTEVTKGNIKIAFSKWFLESWLLTTHHIEAVTLFPCKDVLLLWVLWVRSIIKVGLGRATQTQSVTRQSCSGELICCSPGPATGQKLQFPSGESVSNLRCSSLQPSVGRVAVWVCLTSLAPAPTRLCLGWPDLMMNWMNDQQRSSSSSAPTADIDMSASKNQALWTGVTIYCLFQA